MKKSDNITIGHTYIVKVSGHLVPVRLESVWLWRLDRAQRAHRPRGAHSDGGEAAAGGHIMSCMCGDICCPSCGPAQGNGRCPICRAWTSDECEHMADDGDGLKPEFRAEADRLAAEENAADDALEERMAEEYWSTRELDEEEDA
jgi:hypothetical protein